MFLCNTLNTTDNLLIEGELVVFSKVGTLVASLSHAILAPAVTGRNAVVKLAQQHVVFFSTDYEC